MVLQLAAKNDYYTIASYKSLSENSFQFLKTFMKTTFREIKEQKYIIFQTYIIPTFIFIIIMIYCL